MRAIKILALFCIFGCVCIHGNDTNSSGSLQTSREALELQKEIQLALNKKEVSQEYYDQAIKFFNKFLVLSPEKMYSPEYEYEIPNCLRIINESYTTLQGHVTTRYNLQTKVNIKSLIDIAELFTKQLAAMKIPNYTAKGGLWNVAWAGNTNCIEYDNYLKAAKENDYQLSRRKYQGAIERAQWDIHREFELTLDRLKDPYIKWHREGVADQEWITKDQELYLQMVQMISTYPALMELGVLTPTKRNP